VWPVKRVLLLAVAVCFAARTSPAAPASEDFALALERVGATATVLVVGSWGVDEVQGWSWGICHDGERVSIADCGGMGSNEHPCDPGGCSAVACPADMTAAGPNGEAMAFHSVAVFENGITQGVMLDYLALWTLPASARFEMLEISYDLKGSEAELSFCDTLGAHPTRTTFAVEGRSYPPAVQRGLTLAAGTFRRGNANGDETLNIADAVFALSYIFSAGQVPACFDAVDANDDGRVNIADPIRILAYLFSQTEPLPDPFAACGADPTADQLACERFAPCGAP
jgi:hypothetical protein